ncbi:MerR family transcriptional regulator [Brevibacterium atlanticum]|uniref:MerR family transcriptional regulator n=1 Tax=Brevibacterium atlanticum TaxID=2697563 RepID=UPI0014219D2A
MKIGEAARELGVATHVLRHWEDEGVVVPDRTGAGHRDYSDEHVSRGRIVLSCQSVGMSLAEIRAILHRGEAGRAVIIEARIDAIRRQRAALGTAETFLLHVRGCRHDLMTRFLECSEYAGRAESGETGQDCEMLSENIAICSIEIPRSAQSGGGFGLCHTAGESLTPFWMRSFRPCRRSL